LKLRITIHLANGNSIETNAVDPEVEDAVEYVEYLKNDLEGRPGWRVIENVLVYSQTVAAIEADEIG